MAKDPYKYKGETAEGTTAGGSDKKATDKKVVGPERKPMPKLGPNAIGRPEDYKPKNPDPNGLVTWSSNPSIDSALKSRSKAMAIAKRDLRDRPLTDEERTKRRDSHAAKMGYLIPKKSDESYDALAPKGDASARKSAADHANLLRKVSAAPAHHVEAVKAQLSHHLQTRGHTEGFPDVCTGSGCKNIIPASSDDWYCGGESCYTSQESATPTPRG